MGLLTTIKNMIKVNDRSYSGQSIHISNNRIIINGQDVTPDARVINITVDGELEGGIHADVVSVITVNGNVHGTVATTSGDVDVKGSVAKDVVTTSGDVEIGGNVGAGVQTSSGDVEVAGDVLGGIRTVTGDITHG